MEIFYESKRLVDMLCLNFLSLKAEISSLITNISQNWMHTFPQSQAFFSEKTTYHVWHFLKTINYFN